MTPKSRFYALRSKVADMIRRALEIDNMCKSYEGTWEITTSYRDYFEDETGTLPPNYVAITLHCYVLGPSRHYTWEGKSFAEALSKCEYDISCWKEELND